MLTQLDTQPQPQPTPAPNHDAELNNMLEGYTKMEVAQPPVQTQPETIQKLTFNNKPRKERSDKGKSRINPAVNAPPQAPQTPHPVMGMPPGATPPPTPNKTVISSEIISGALFLLLVDMLLPMVIVTINNIAGKHSIDIEKLQLTDKQKKDLEPMAEKAMKQATVQLDPIWTLVLAMSGIYGMNFFHLKRQAEIKAKRDKT